jgi:hypothetical protein
MSHALLFSSAAADCNTVAQVTKQGSLPQQVTPSGSRFMISLLIIVVRLLCNESDGGCLSPRDIESAWTDKPHSEEGVKAERRIHMMSEHFT